MSLCEQTSTHSQVGVDLQPPDTQDGRQAMPEPLTPCLPREQGRMRSSWRKLRYTGLTRTESEGRVHVGRGKKVWVGAKKGARHT